MYKRFKLNKFKEIILLFLIGFAILTSIEFIAGYLIEKIFHVVFWDYSNLKFNIGNYISLEMALVWGISAVFLIYVLKPITDKIVKKIPKFLTWVLVILFIIDLICTFIFFKN